MYLLTAAFIFCFYNQVIICFSQNQYLHIYMATCSHSCLLDLLERPTFLCPFILVFWFDLHSLVTHSHEY